MSHVYGKSWWSLLLRGIAALVFGILAIAHPAGVLSVLVTLIGVFILVVGAIAVIGALMHRGDSRRWLMALIPGVAGVVIGLIMMVYPALTVAVIVYLIAVWALVHGIIEIYNAVRMRRDLAGERLPIVIGVISVVFGIILLVYPIEAAATVVWLLGLFLLVIGVLWVISGFRARTPRPPVE
jgi:uncharacterized membrane protein HdeD (DUF308 family)